MSPWTDDTYNNDIWMILTITIYDWAVPELTKTVTWHYEYNHQSISQVGNNSEEIYIS